MKNICNKAFSIWAILEENFINNDIEYFTCKCDKSNKFNIEFIYKLKGNNQLIVNNFSKRKLPELRKQMHPNSLKNLKNNKKSLNVDNTSDSGIDNEYNEKLNIVEVDKNINNDTPYIDFSSDNSNDNISNNNFDKPTLKAEKMLINSTIELSDIGNKENNYCNINNEKFITKDFHLKKIETNNIKSLNNNILNYIEDKNCNKLYFSIMKSINKICDNNKVLSLETSNLISKLLYLFDEIGFYNYLGTSKIEYSDIYKIG